MTAPPPAVAVHDIRSRYSQTLAVVAVGGVVVVFEVNDGEFFGLLGPNGGG